MGPILKVAHYVCENTLKSEKIRTSKHFWSKSFWIRATQPVYSEFFYQHEMVFRSSCLVLHINYVNCTDSDPLFPARLSLSMETVFSSY